MNNLLLLIIKKNKKYIDFLKYLKGLDKRSQNSIDEWVYALFDRFNSSFIDLFLIFLDEQGQLKDTFMENIKQQGKVFERYSIPKLVTHSFYWAETKQGHNFWCDVHYKWIKYIANKVLEPLINDKVYEEIFILQHNNGYVLHP